MTPQTPPLPLCVDFVRSLVSATRTVQLYAPTHPLVAHSLDRLLSTLAELHAIQPSVTLGILGSGIVLGDTPIQAASVQSAGLLRQFEQRHVERITIEQGVTRDELANFVKALAAQGRGDAPAQIDLSSPRIRVGRIQVDQRVDELAADVAAVRRLYADAVEVSQALWEAAVTEEALDPTSARTMVEKLALAVSQNRTALVALTALKDYDNYTFTHMVNVSILTMAQARTLGVDGPLLREFGLSALMHDIGKVHVPPEILNKPSKLSDEEFGIMKRHTIDGAEMLRVTPEMPALAPVVALEHHLRLDGTGYPEGVSRRSLNLATMLCGIADVYDAMRSQRRYQQAFPTERILAVLKQNDGKQFDQHLVRRFSQLIGIYPPGNLVRLNTGEVAVVLRTYAPDPFRPEVRVVFSPEGSRLAVPYDISLWKIEEQELVASRVIEPLDPKEFNIDPLNYL